MFRIVWEKPEIGLPARLDSAKRAGRQGVAEGVHNLLKRPTKKEREQRMVWTHKERVLVGIILAMTIIASVYFWYKGQGKLPEFKIGSPSFGGFGFNQTVILEK